MCCSRAGSVGGQGSSCALGKVFVNGAGKGEVCRDDAEEKFRAAARISKQLVVRKSLEKGKSSYFAHIAAMQ